VEGILSLTKWFTWIGQPFTAAMNGMRRMTQMLFPMEQYGFRGYHGSSYDYVAAVGDGTGSSTVMAPLLWMARTFPEAPPALYQRDDTGEEQPVYDHKMLRLLERPNGFHSGITIWMATLVDWLVNGDAYWYKNRPRSGGAPVELWWLPSWAVTPRIRPTWEPPVPPSPADPTAMWQTYISGYDYYVDGSPFWIERADIVHFRYGLDPENPRKGLTPLRSVLREVFSDDEAANFTAALLRNMGVPGVMVSPDSAQPISEEDAIATKQYLTEKFAGDLRGEPLVMTSKTNVEQFGFNPTEMALTDLRRVPEERVTAVLGVPAIVAGLGAGLQRSTFTNFSEARQAAYEAGVIPNQRILAEDVRWQLLPEWETDPFLWRFGFDLSKVKVLQEDVYRMVQRHNIGVNGGWEMVSEARKAAGLTVDPTRDEVFLRQANVNVMRSSVFGNGSVPTGTQNAPPANGGADAPAIAREVVAEIERHRLAQP